MLPPGLLGDYDAALEVEVLSVWVDTTTLLPDRRHRLSIDSTSLWFAYGFTLCNWPSMDNITVARLDSVQGHIVFPLQFGHM